MTLHHDMSAIKHIPIEQLSVGMYIVGMDLPWYRTPFLLHKWLVVNPADIAQLVRYGVREVSIDVTRGLDVGQPAPVEPPATESDEDSPKLAAENVATVAVMDDVSEVAKAKPSINETTTTTTPTFITTESSAPHQPPPAPQEVEAAAKAAVHEAMAAADRVFTDLDSGRPPQLVTLKHIVTNILQRILADPEAMMMHLFIEKMRRFDRSLSSHGMDVCVLALIVGVEYGCSETDQDALGIGALLHDIGYVRLPRNLYRKPSALTEHEQALMQQHPQLAATVVTQHEPWPDAITRIMTQHHEWADGSGFPKKLKADQISPLAQVVGVVDTYDGMVGGREGRAPMLPHDAIRQLFVLGEKGRYDKALIQVAIKALGVYPIGSLIKLNTSEQAVVTGINHVDRLKPKIRIISGPNGEQHRDSIDVDLAAVEAEAPPRTILRALDPLKEQIDLPACLEVTVKRTA